MRKTYFVLATFSLALAFTAISCGDDDGGGTDYASQADCASFPSSVTSYDLVVKPILDTYCASAGCHDAITASEGIDLSDYTKSKNAFDKKDVLCSIHHGKDCVAMPQGSDKLDDTTINILDCWAKNDYPE
ncbi:MAG: hypothetical protein IPN76_31875 [Saprospiraceae bacterium]|nr:hypothetical protein [Saprospiraceae bacterium]